MNLAVRILSSRLMNFVPSQLIFLSKYGHWDLCLDLVLTVIMVSRSIISAYLEESYELYRVVIVVYFVLLLIAFLVNHFTHPFYNDIQHNIKSFQITYLLFLSFLNIAVRETNVFFLASENSTIIVMLVSLSIFVKLNHNISRSNFSKICAQIESRGFKYSEKLVLQLYIELVQLVDIKIKSQISSDTRRKNTDPGVVLSVKHLLSEHEKTCARVSCYCRDKRLFRERNALSLFDNKLGNTEVYEILMYIEIMLFDLQAT